MNSIRAELCEVVRGVLSNDDSPKEKNAQDVMSDLAPLLGEAIADAVLDEFHVKRRLLSRRSQKLTSETDDLKKYAFTYDPIGRERYAAVMEYARPTQSQTDCQTPTNADGDPANLYPDAAG